MIDIFNDYSLQREELLARIAHELQLDRTRLERMESAYIAVANLLRSDDQFFKDLVIEVYAQGSKRIGTTVKPINKEDFDLDTVLHIFDPYYNHTPEAIYNALVKALEKDPYYKSIMEKKTRCVRLNYKGDFHMDILPACMPDLSEKEMIKIPEKVLKNWSSGNPKGFANWFMNKANTVDSSMLRLFSAVLNEAKVEAEPLPDELYDKQPLQRAVQLLKRYRDVFFQNKDYRVSSIVITTLAAGFYQGESSIFETINNILTRVKDNYTQTINSGYKFKILNPMNKEEDFTDSWDENHYKSFYAFIVDLYTKWENLKNSFDTSSGDYIKLFGEGVYKKTLTEQVKAFSRSTSDVVTKSAGLIVGNNAYTNSKGNINSNSGTKNEPHHNFGGLY